MAIGQDILNWSIIVILIILSATFSGLTLGLMSLDNIGLEVVIGGDPESNEAKYARKIQPIRAKGNLLLCTLLLGNTCVNSTLSILLAGYTGGAIGVVLSTALTLIFGEIIPQATCNRHALYIGSHAIKLVKVFMVVFYPITYPISYFLDRFFGEEIGAIYTSNQLSKLLELHVKHDQLNQEQAQIMNGAIVYKEKKVEQVMTQMQKVFMIKKEEVLNFDTMRKIFQTGNSRIPVYEEASENVSHLQIIDQLDIQGHKYPRYVNIVGLLLVKDLILIDPEDQVTVEAVVEFFGRPINYVWKETDLSEALALFKSGKGHLAIVREVKTLDENKDPVYVMAGLITLEDIIEEIIQDEIVDETDLYVQVENDATRIQRQNKFKNQLSEATLQKLNFLIQQRRAESKKRTPGTDGTPNVIKIS
eukprot:snap_masked-scaffold_5-processed-gene-16.44-mRNA-1 protein AED:0.05 eAED:0.06 QI:0/-1/0/1/-1/1/1/0/418